jgi:hypothetical protein
MSDKQTLSILNTIESLFQKQNESIKETFAQHKESNTVVTSQFIKETQGFQKRTEIMFQEITEKLDKQIEITANTPLVNKAVFAVIGMIVIGFFATIGAFVWSKLSAVFVVVK